MKTKNEVTHTPGPWSIACKIIDPRHWYSVNQESWNTKLLNGESEANARLISAAPELLAACKEAVAVIKTQNGGDCLVSLLDAISKAGGNQ